MLALAFLLGGAAVVAVGIGALVTYLHHRLDRFADLHRDLLERDGYLLGRVEEAIAQAARATKYASSTFDAQRIVERASEREQRSSVEAARRAQIRRLRVARARAGRSW